MLKSIILSKGYTKNVAVFVDESLCKICKQQLHPPMLACIESKAVFHKKCDFDDWYRTFNKTGEHCHPPIHEIKIEKIKA